MNYGTIVLIKLSLLYLHLPFHLFFLLSLSLSLPLSSTLVLGNKYSRVLLLHMLLPREIWYVPILYACPTPVPFPWYLLLLCRSCTQCTVPFCLQTITSPNHECGVQRETL